MIKFNKKILKFSAYLVLVGYLSATIAYAVHYHNVAIGNNSTLLSSNQNNNTNHFLINGSEISCPVHIAYNSLNNSTVSSDSPFLTFEKIPEFFGSLLVLSKPTKECINHYQLRAPPISFFS